MQAGNLVGRPSEPSALLGIAPTILVVGLAASFGVGILDGIDAIGVGAVGASLAPLGIAGDIIVVFHRYQRISP